MTEPRTSRAFQERFLDGFDRSELRREVRKVHPAPSRSAMRKRYATWALGASLAFGGLGIPLKVSGMLRDAQQSGSQTQPDPVNSPAASTPSQIVKDLRVAEQIASQVTGGVSEATSEIGQVMKVSNPAGAPVVNGDLSSAAELIKEKFFSREIPFGQIIYTEARKNDLSPELVAAVVSTESRFVPTARSQRGAIGLMQLVPATGKWMGARDLTNPAQNISAGAKYLKYLSDRFGGDEQKTIAAYNAGEGNVRRFNGVPPFRETQAYVARVNSAQSDIGQRLGGEQPVQMAEVR